MMDIIIGRFKLRSKLPYPGVVGGPDLDPDHHADLLPQRLVKGGSLGGMYKAAIHGSSHPPGGGSDEGLVGGVGGRGGVKGDESDVTRCGRGLVLQLGLRCPRHGGGRSPVRSAWERWWGRMIGSVRVEALDPGAVQVLDAPVVCVGASGAVARTR